MQTSVDSWHSSCKIPAHPCRQTASRIVEESAGWSCFFLDGLPKVCYEQFQVQSADMTGVEPVVRQYPQGLKPMASILIDKAILPEEFPSFLFLSILVDGTANNFQCVVLFLKLLKLLRRYIWNMVSDTKPAPVIVSFFPLLAPLLCLGHLEISLHPAPHMASQSLQFPLQWHCCRLRPLPTQLAVLQTPGLSACILLQPPGSLRA